MKIICHKRSEAAKCGNLSWKPAENKNSKDYKPVRFPVFKYPFSGFSFPFGFVEKPTHSRN